MTLMAGRSYYQTPVPGLALPVLPSNVLLPSNSLIHSGQTPSHNMDQGKDRWGFIKFTTALLQGLTPWSPQSPDTVLLTPIALADRGLMSCISRLGWAACNSRGKTPLLVPQPSSSFPHTGRLFRSSLPHDHIGPPKEYTGPLPSQVKYICENHRPCPWSRMLTKPRHPLPSRESFLHRGLIAQERDLDLVHCPMCKYLSCGEPWLRKDLVPHEPKS